MSSNNEIDVNRPMTAETMPLYYSVFEPHLQGMFPGRDLVADPIKIMDFVKEFIIPAQSNWKYTIDAAAANQDVTDQFIVDLIRDYAPNAIYFDGAFRFKDENDMTHAKMKHF